MNGSPAPANFLYPFASVQNSWTIKQSQHLPKSLINNLPVAPILTFTYLNLTTNISGNRQSRSFTPFNSSADAKMKNFQLTCTRLERAILSDFLLNGMTGNLNIQWDNLTHLTLHFMCINDSFPYSAQGPPTGLL